MMYPSGTGKITEICRLFHEIVKQMKQVKQDFGLKYCIWGDSEKVVKQNETTYPSVFLSIILSFFIDNQSIADCQFWSDETRSLKQDETKLQVFW